MLETIILEVMVFILHIAIKSKGLSIALNSVVHNSHSYVIFNF